MFALLPWSVEWPVGKTWSLNLPAEPLIAICGLGVLTALLRNRKIHLPGLAWIAVAWIGWQVVTTFFSTMPLVSWKYWLVEAGQWGVFFIGLLLWPQLWPRLIQIFTYSLAGMAVYSLGHHAFYQFQADQAVLAPMPFFADHTVYSAVLVMVLLGYGLPQILIPKLASSTRFRMVALAAPETSNFIPRPRDQTSNLTGFRMVALAVPALFFLALCSTFSRAAWGSLFVTAFTGLALYFPKRWPWFLLVGLMAAGVGFVFRENISARLSADVSSLERLNRYSCALRMAKDRPWTGFGPGTFQFQYLPYQRTAEMTRISVTEPISRRWPGNYGRGGGAHSEYFQALAEKGRPGLICWILLMAGSMLLGIRRYRRDGQLYWLAITLSLLSFFLHGLVNNFLHDARVAALVWGQLAVLVSKCQSSINPLSLQRLR